MVPAEAQAGVNELLLTIRLPNGEEQLRSVLRDAEQRFWLDELLLQDWRLLRLPSQRLQRTGIRWYPLDAIAGARYQYDACAQSLRIDLAGVPRTPLNYSIAGASTARPPATADPGAYLNLDSQYSRVGDEDAVGFYGEAVVFGPLGRAQQSFVANDGDWHRLDSTWVSEWPGKAYSLAIGDSVGSAGSWGQPVRYGGIRFATDFSLQPYLVTFPQPLVRGDSALPSTLDIFINDSLRGRQQVGDGPFVISDLPTLTGGGQAVLVTRDALGRETRAVVPFYVSPQLLRPGLSNFALDAGLQRRNYGIASADYANGFASFTHRRGISEQFTREFRVEAQRDNAAAGASALLLLNTFGLLTATGAYSGGGDGHGALAGLGFERNLFGRYGLSLRSQWAQSGFRQLGQAEDVEASRHSDFASISMTPHAGATLAFAYAYEDRRGQDNLELRTLGYSLRLGRSWQLGVSAVEARSSSRERSLLASLSCQFDGAISAGLQHEWHNRRDDAWQASVQHSPGGPLGLGYRADVETGAFERSAVRADWGTQAARFSGEGVDDDQGGGVRLGASTALVHLAGNTFVTRPVQSSFAVVHAAGLPGVGVYQDNRLVAHTDARGNALLPELRPYEENRIALRAEEVPVEWPLENLIRQAVPRGRSGLVVDFNPDARLGAEFIVVDATGRPIPAGAQVKDAASGDTYPVGRDGRIYLRATPGRHVLRITASNLSCVARVMLDEKAAAGATSAQCRAEPP